MTAAPKNPRASPGRVLVTGGAGYIGSRLVAELLRRGWEVRILDLLLYGDAGPRSLEAEASGSDWRDRFEVHVGDIRDPAAVQAALSGVDAVINLAGVAHNALYDFDEILMRQCNYDALGMLLSLARAAGVRRVIQASTSTVFGVRSEASVTEELEPEPVGYYARYKALSEWLMVGAGGSDLCTVSVRAGSVCGWSPRQRFDLTINKLTADALTKRVICVHGGTQRRPVVHIEDLVACYAMLLEVDPARVSGRTFNVAFETLSVIEMAERIRRELTDLDVQIDVVDIADARDHRLDADRIRRELGFQPTRPLEHAVRELRHHALELGTWTDTDAAIHYNKRCMKLERTTAPYRYMGSGSP